VEVNGEEGSSRGAEEKDAAEPARWRSELGGAGGSEAEAKAGCQRWDGGGSGSEEESEMGGIDGSLEGGRLKGGGRDGRSELERVSFGSGSERTKDEGQYYIYRLPLYL